MQEKSQASQAPAHPSAALSPETISVLTEKFLEFVESLKTQNLNGTPEPQAEEAFKEPDSLRCYRIPASILKYEQETLKKFKAADLLELLRKARDGFYLTALLLQRFHEDNEPNGFLVQQLGERLNYPIRMLNDLCGIFADYDLEDPQIHNTKPPAGELLGVFGVGDIQIFK